MNKIINLNININTIIYKEQDNPVNVIALITIEIILLLLLLANRRTESLPFRKSCMLLTKQTAHTLSLNTHPTHKKKKKISFLYTATPKQFSKFICRNTYAHEKETTKNFNIQNKIAPKNIKEANRNINLKDKISQNIFLKMKKITIDLIYNLDKFIKEPITTKTINSCMQSDQKRKREQGSQSKPVSQIKKKKTEEDAINPKPLETTTKRTNNNKSDNRQKTNQPKPITAIQRSNSLGDIRQLSRGEKRKITINYKKKITEEITNRMPSVTDE